MSNNSNSVNSINNYINPLKIYKYKDKEVLDNINNYNYNNKESNNINIDNNNIDKPIEDINIDNLILDNNIDNIIEDNNNNILSTATNNTKKKTTKKKIIPESLKVGQGAAGREKAKALQSKEKAIAKKTGKINFKDDYGRLRSHSLFIETARISSVDMVKYPPAFTFADEDRDGCISMKKRYLEIADPTEYKVAIELLGSYKHWRNLCETKWFSAHVDLWRAELKTKLKSEAFNRMCDQAYLGGNGAVAANKWIYDIIGGKVDPRLTNRGRPSKEQNKLYEQELEDDALRINLDRPSEE